MIYRREIDGLRAVAVASVVVFHAVPGTIPAGFIGVDVFFVISGYLIGSLLLNVVDGPSVGFGIASFYARRLQRVFPALLAVMLCTVVFGAIYLTPSEMHDLVYSAASASFGASNIYFWRTANYFAAASEFKPLLTTWSLGVEEQFYLVAPVLLVLIARWRRSAVAPTVALLCLVSLAASVVLTRVAPSAAYYLLPSRWFELGAGLLLAATWNMPQVARLRGSVRFGNILLAAGLSLIGGSAFLISAASGFPGPLAVVPTLGAAMVILAERSSWSARTLGAEPMVWIGKLSYSIYLWHWPLLSFARIGAGGDISDGAVVVLLAAVLGLSYLSWRFIETPFRHHGRAPRTVIVTAVSSAAAVACVILALGVVNRTLVPRTVEIAALERQGGRLQGYRCLISGRSLASPAAECIDIKPQTIALLGDSHAAVLGPHLRDMAKRLNYGFAQITRSECPPLVDATRAIAASPSNASDCARHNRFTFDLLRKDDRITHVVLSAFWSAPFLNAERDAHGAYRATEDAEAQGDDREMMRAALVRTVQALESLGKTVVVVADVPVFKFNPLIWARSSASRLRRGLGELVARRRIYPEASHVDEVETGPLIANTILAGSEATLPKTLLINPSATFCADSQCLFKRGAELLYTDHHHLSDRGAEILLRPFEVRLRAPVDDAAP